MEHTWISRARRKTPLHLAAAYADAIELEMSRFRHANVYLRASIVFAPQYFSMTPSSNGRATSQMDNPNLSSDKNDYPALWYSIDFAELGEDPGLEKLQMRSGCAPRCELSRTPAKEERKDPDREDQESGAE